MADIPPEVMEANLRAGEKIAAMGARVVHEQALQPSAATRTIHKDGLVTDGPFLESKEVIAGFFVVETTDLEDGGRHRQAAPDHGWRRRGAAAARGVTSVQQAVADAHRREWATVLAATVRVTRDLDLAEECVQDAYADALDAWTRGGVPARPGAWLTTAARHNALDALRRARTLRSKLHLLVEPEAAGSISPPTRWFHDDRLRLVFLCCHPALDTKAQVALTLRLVCGVTTPDIAQAFLVSETTMAARITRAKKKIAAARIPFRMPAPGELPDRLDAALTAIHLLFTTGHTAPAGPALTKDDIATRALDLARLLRDLMPDEREVRGTARAAAGQPRPPGHPHHRGRAPAARWRNRTVRPGTGRPIAEAHDLVLGALRGGDPGPVRRAGRHRGAARDRTDVRRHGLGPDPGALRRAVESRGRRRWSRSTGPWRSRWSAGRRPRWPRSRRSNGTRGSPATATCRRSRPTCCAGWAAGPTPP